jgi:hypothetical protein
MSARSGFARFLALLCATVQLASPGLSAVADGALARANASQPQTHVESTTTANCPVVHPPDCAICRYLSSAASPPSLAPVAFEYCAESREPRAESLLRPSGAVTLPHGRAPPAI